LNTFRDPNNLLFQLARQGRRLTRWWAVPLLLLLFTLAGGPGLLVPLEPASESGLWRSALETAAFFVASYLPVALLVGIWVWRREGRGPGTLGLRRSGAVRFSLYGFLFGFGLIASGVVLIVTTGDATITFDQGDTVGWIAIAPGLVVLAGWAIQGTTEELMFRGWMLQNSGAQIGPLAGIAFTTVFFTMLHLGNPGITALSVLNLLLVGVLFTMIALLEGGIWAASACHVSWNWAQSNVFGLNVSGLEVGGGSFVQVLPNGADTILGGEFGFEGSVAATTTLVIGIVVVLAISAREAGVGSGE
jgi:membrane protease YdiL (CAAX protease family)